MPEATVKIQVEQSVTFKRQKNVSLPGSSLWFELPGVTCQQVRSLFGTGLATQRKEKYSQSIVIKSSATGQLYTLYMCYGVWRVGAHRSNSIDEAALKQLFGQ